MVFWRKQKNQGRHEEDEKSERLLHPQGEPSLQPSAQEQDSSSEQQGLDILENAEMDASEGNVLENMQETPLPSRTMRALNHKKEGGWLSRLTQGLSKSAGRLGQGIADFVSKRHLEGQSLAALEDTLIQADLGPTAAAHIVKNFSRTRFTNEASQDEIKSVLATHIQEILTPVEHPLVFTKPQKGPFVLMLCGVNGSGKTTTAGKLAHHLVFVDKKRVMLAAADTFRAAAVEQLEAWATRAHCPIIKGEIGADAAALVFEAYEKACALNKDILIIDTAGRLHNKANLMAELGKIVRVLQKRDPAAPHGCLLVLDGTSGQNAHTQVEMFCEVAPITGLVVTKLDGAAKGGVVVALAQHFKVPISFVGVGEGVEDVHPFCAQDYARALVGLRETP